jgi:Fe-S-cluster formation regulator IscX/YfhJ
VQLGAVGTQLANLASDFDPRTYGFRKLSDWVRKTNAFDIEQVEEKPLRIRVRKVITRAKKKAWFHCWENIWDSEL